MRENFLKLEKLNEGPVHTQEHLSLWRQPFQDVRFGHAFVLDSGELVYHVCHDVSYSSQGSGFLVRFQTLVPTECDKMHNLSNM